MPEWQPIETAPKDGTRILLFRDISNSGLIEVGQWEVDKYATNPRPYWTGDGERLWGVREYRTKQPTHWMPLPKPPGAA